MFFVVFVFSKNFWGPRASKKQQQDKTIKQQTDDDNNVVSPSGENSSSSNIVDLHWFLIKTPELN